MTTVREKEKEEEESEGFRRCNYCRRLYLRLLLHITTVYYSHGFSKLDVSQCNECIQDDIKARRLNKSENTGYTITPATWHEEAYDSICQSIEDMCSHKFDHIVNYYDAVKAAYLKETPKMENQYNPMTIRDYLLGLDIKDVNKINKNLKALWPFTYDLVNTENRVKVVNKDADNLLVSWIDG
jgi:hypothetical protein